MVHYKHQDPPGETTMTNPLDDTLRFQQTALNLRAYRQQVLASNIANTDTPGFKARDIDFKSALQDALNGKAGGGGVQLARTNAGHLPGQAMSATNGALLYRTETQSAVDGNTVNMDIERGQFAENTVQYEASVNFVTNLLKTMQNALSS